MLDLAEKWAQVFSVLGSGERLSVMIVLHGSRYIRHSHGSLEDKGCLSFTQIRESAEIESDTRLSYHLSRLIDAGLVSKLAVKRDNRVFPLYTVSDKWLDFTSDLGIDNQIKAYIQKKYPETFVEES